MTGRANDPNELIPHPWSDLHKRERREVLVPDLLFSVGISTLVAQSGEGKTTLAMSIKRAMETGKWGNAPIKKRPVVWVAGEGQNDMQPMYEANGQHFKLPSSPSPEGFYLDEPVDLSTSAGTDSFIKLLENTHGALIVLDALADMIGDLDENTAKDMNRVYHNIWRVVRETGASVLVLHHSGWDEKRERGSTAIRAKSDIVIQLVSLDAQSGTLALKHNKRRGGCKLKEFFFGVELVTVAGYPEPIPIVTGPKAEAVLNEPANADEANARKLVGVMVQRFPGGAACNELETQSGMSSSTFYRGLSHATRKQWLVKRGKRYNLSPDSLLSKSASLSLPPSTPSRGVEVVEVEEVTSKKVNWKQNGSESNTDGCNNDHATANGKNTNKNNEGENSPPIALGPSDDELIRQGMERVSSAARPQGRAR